ncbi:hypothetical protein U1Q18_022700 [Sarracenia purpurea var. burkii]
MRAIRSTSAVSERSQRDELARVEFDELQGLNLTERQPPSWNGRTHGSGPSAAKQAHGGATVVDRTGYGSRNLPLPFSPLCALPSPNSIAQQISRLAQQGGHGDDTDSSSDEDDN